MDLSTIKTKILDDIAEHQNAIDGLQDAINCIETEKCTYKTVFAYEGGSEVEGESEMSLDEATGKAFEMVLALQAGANKCDIRKFVELNGMWFEFEELRRTLTFSL
jgi:hypothetical protein